MSVLEIFLACINQSIHQRAEKDLRRRICETQRRSTERNFLNEEHITPIHHHVFTYSITSLNFLRVMEKKRRRLKADSSRKKFSIACKNNSKTTLDDDKKEEEDDAEARRANGLSERFSILYCGEFVFCV